MNRLALLAAVLGALAASWAMTDMVRRYALRASMLDHPNERSSHTLPTPRGGGLAIVASFVLLLAMQAAYGQVPADLAAALAVAGLLVAAAGFADDRWGLAARWRFGAHVLAAVAAIALVGRMPEVQVLGLRVDLGLAVPVLTALFIVWSVNHFNFMDGIDGIASIQAITVLCGGAAVSWLAGEPRALPVALGLSAAVAGFAYWNFPKARIFMGDAGSGFLGLAIATLTLWHAGQQFPLCFAWLILSACFMVDASTTLVRRLLRGERVHEAHRTHAYQYASRRLGSHVPVTLAVAGINLFWLLPWAALVATGRVDGLVAMTVAYAPLVLLAYRLHAGARERQAA